MSINCNNVLRFIKYYVHWLTKVWIVQIFRFYKKFLWTYYTLYEIFWNFISIVMRRYYYRHAIEKCEMNLKMYKYWNYITSLHFAVITYYITSSPFLISYRY